MNMRIKNATKKKSPVGKYPASSPGDWRKMSFPVMLQGETVKEILQATQVTRDIVDALAPKKSRKSKRSTMTEEAEGPKTPETQRKPRKPDPETVSSNIKVRRKREKQNKRTISDSSFYTKGLFENRLQDCLSTEIRRKGSPKASVSPTKVGNKTQKLQPLQC